MIRKGPYRGRSKSVIISEEICTSFRTVKMTRTVLIDIKVAMVTQEDSAKHKRNDKTQLAGITLKRGS